jgi:hypothetical protein
MDTPMAFSLQAAGPILHWFTLVILCVFPVVGAIVVYKLGALPGAIAASRRHPQAAAINICGWMGIVSLVLWPVAIVWAHIVPRAVEDAGAVGQDDARALLDGLRRASQRLAAIEGKMPKAGAPDGAST